MPWLVRHGESEANVGVATSDYAAISLTGRGQEQAERVAAACPPQPERVVLSPYRRARQTAEPLLRRFPGVHVEEQSVQEFTYLAADRCRGMTPEQRQPLVDAYWSRMNPEYCDGEGAESFGAFAARVRAFLLRAREWSGLSVVFSHEQFIRAAIYEALLGDLESTSEAMGRFFALRSAFSIPNCAIVRMELRDARWWVGGVDRLHLRCAALPRNH
jgi:2,3-bisphosphoglycerate-dependent phosphoglycerate mutase